MNEIKLKGVIKNTEYSHNIGDVEYYKSDLIVPKENGEDIIPLKYKKLSNRYEDNTEIILNGNIRSYSEKLDNGKNKVSIYVFTYFDVPLGIMNKNNDAIIDGRICKKDAVRNIDGHNYLHFILANNIISTGKNQKINNYIPCIALDEFANIIANMNISDILKLSGELHSREYDKYLPNNEVEHKVAYEFIISNILE